VAGVGTALAATAEKEMGRTGAGVAMATGWTEVWAIETGAMEIGDVATGWSRSAMRVWCRASRSRYLRCQ
jgi:hypothetical protein